MGTLRYMSPEQARGQALDPRTDLFSLGVVLYEAATGCRPFEDETPHAVRQALLDATPVPPTRLASDLPAGFDRVIGRALATDRDQRYQTAAELAAGVREELARDWPDRPSGLWRPYGANTVSVGP